MKFGQSIVAVFVVSLMVAGCAPKGDKGTTGVHESHLVDDSHPSATLVLGDESLYREIDLLEPKVREKGALKQASVTVQNLSDVNYKLEYRFDWSDREGFETHQGSWTNFELSAQEVERFTSTAKSPEAHQFTFTVRPAGGSTDAYYGGGGEAEPEE